MTPTQLREIGVALYGRRFASDLARDLRVAIRTVQRWLTGDRAIPSNLHSELSSLLKARAKVLHRLASRS